MSAFEREASLNPALRWDAGAGQPTAASTQASWQSSGAKTRRGGQASAATATAAAAVPQSRGSSTPSPPVAGGPAPSAPGMCPERGAPWGPQAPLMPFHAASGSAAAGPLPQGAPHQPSASGQQLGSAPGWKRRSGEEAAAGAGPCPPGQQGDRLQEPQPQQHGAGGDAAAAQGQGEWDLYTDILPSSGPLLQVAEQLLEQQGGRVVGALLCGVPSQESWALNALTLLSFHTAVRLVDVPGLAAALVKIVQRGFPPAFQAAAGSGAAPPASQLQPWESQDGSLPQPRPQIPHPCNQHGESGHLGAMQRWNHILPNHIQMEYRAQAAAAAAAVLYNAATAVPDANAPLLLSMPSLRCWIHILQAAHDMYSVPQGAAAPTAVVRWQCQQPFLTETAVTVLHLLERLAPHTKLPPPAVAASAGSPGQEGSGGSGGSGGGSGGGGEGVQGLLSRLLPCVVALVAPGRPLLPLHLCTAALDTLTAWAAAGNAMPVQQCCTPANPQLLRNVAELLACPFDSIREQAEEGLVDEGGFPEAGEDGSGLREVCIDMATVIQQVRLLASATQLLLRVVSSRVVEVRRSVALHTRLIKLLAGVAAHDHPGYPLSWQVNPTRAAHLTAIKDRMLPLFEHRSIVLKQARMHATTILASLAFDPATRQYVLPYEAQILQQVMCGRVPADGPMNALLAAFCQT